MKRKLFAFVGALALFGLCTLPALAAIETGEKYAFVADDEVIDDDLFIAAEQVVIEGVVNGDVFAAGSKISVTGTINGDLYVVGATLSVSGVVTQDVIAVADTVALDGAQIGDGMITAGSIIILDSDSSIGGGLLYAAESMDMDANVARGMMGASTETSFNGSVGKDVLLTAGELTVQTEAHVEGDLKYWASEEAEIGPSIVAGEIEFLERHQSAQVERSPQERLMAKIGTNIWSYLSALLIGALILTFVPKLYHRTGKEVMEHPVMALVYGMAFVVGVPFAVMLLMFTVVGLPLALIALADYFVILYVAKIFVAAIFTAALLKWTQWKWLKKGNEYLVFAVMLLLFFVLKNIPYVGGVIQGISLFLAWGALLIASFEGMQVLKKAKW